MIFPDFQRNNTQGGNDPKLRSLNEKVKDMGKVGRNTPCPCGSGKKYKKCCQKSSSEPIDYLWRKLSDLDRNLSNQLARYSRKIYNEEAPRAAWDDFVNYQDDKSFDLDSIHDQFFFYWYLYNWRPEPEYLEEDSEVDLDHLPVIAESYLAKHKRNLSELECTYIQLICDQNYSFHEVIECKQGEGFTLRDILLEKETYVMERSGSENTQKSDILFGRVIQYEHVGLLIGCGAVMIPPSYKPLIIDLRIAMRVGKRRITAENLHDWNVEIRELYFGIFEQLHTPPKLCNSDGDPLCMYELFFDITSPQIAFERLQTLALDISKEELLEEAEFDVEGQIKRVAFRWLKKGHHLKSVGYTSLGDIIIEERQLRVSVNSKNRAEKIHKEIEKLLGDQTTYRVTKIQSIDSLLAESDSKSESAEDPLISHHEIGPEAQELLEQTLDDHWHQWINSKLPALGEKSPYEAVKNKDGREKVAALLDHFERYDRLRKSGIGQQKYIDRARQQLGIS